MREIVEVQRSSKSKLKFHAGEGTIRGRGPGAEALNGPSDDRCSRLRLSLHHRAPWWTQRENTKRKKKTQKPLRRRQEPETVGIKIKQEAQKINHESERKQLKEDQSMSLVQKWTETLKCLDRT